MCCQVCEAAYKQRPVFHQAGICQRAQVFYAQLIEFCILKTVSMIFVFIARIGNMFNFRV